MNMWVTPFVSAQISQTTIIDFEDSEDSSDGFSVSEAEQVLLSSSRTVRDDDEEEGIDDDGKITREEDDDDDEEIWEFWKEAMRVSCICKRWAYFSLSEKWMPCPSSSSSSSRQ